MAALSCGGGVALAAICALNGDERFYSRVAMPLVHLIDPEQAHRAAVWAAKHRIVPRNTFRDDPSLHVNALGMSLSSPLGLAAGFDKDAEAVDGLLGMGFAFVEVGSVTPEPQPGNPRPRVFRLDADEAVINRYGFNSRGHEAVAENLKRRRSDAGCVGVNLGKNKTSPDAVDDYVRGVKTLGSHADYIVVNVSSPNTPGLRSLQQKQQLSQLISSVLKARDALPGQRRVPVLLKVAPDLDDAQRRDIADLVTNDPSCRVDGLVVSNTTVRRPDGLRADRELRDQEGGLSGKPLADVATATIAHFYALTKGAVPIVGVGGITSGADAYAKVRAGATLLQVYTALAFQGPPVVTKIKRELAEILKQEGFTSVQDAVGADHKTQQAPKK